MFVEDFAPYLAEYGTDGVLAGQAVRGIFDNGYFETMGVATRGPCTYSLPTADVGAAGQGSTLVVAAGENAGTYRVVVAKPDGTGWSTLKLEKQP